MYNFNLLGHVMSFRSEIKKHINENNPDRVKDYVCQAYTDFNPSLFVEHPCFEHVMEGLTFLKTHGWSAKVYVWKNIGTQLVLITPNNEYYHSSYVYNSDEISA